MSQKQRARKGKSHISIVLDRTGSMESIRDDTIGGFNTFLAEQKKVHGKSTITLAQFDTQDPFEVLYDFLPIAEAEPLTRETYVPRAWTPLLDAMGRGINATEKSIADFPKKDRPDKVAFVVITDGQENSSHEFTKAQVEKMLKEKQDAGWQVVFLGADLAGINDVVDMGLRPAAAMAFGKTGQQVNAMFASLSDHYTAYCCTDSIDHNISFTDEDRAKQTTQGGTTQ